MHRGRRSGAPTTTTALPLPVGCLCVPAAGEQVQEGRRRRGIRVGALVLLYHTDEHRRQRHGPEGGLARVQLVHCAQARPVSPLAGKIVAQLMVESSRPI